MGVRSRRKKEEKHSALEKGRIVKGKEERERGGQEKDRRRRKQWKYSRNKRDKRFGDGKG